jgi:hypothetical protein
MTITKARRAKIAFEAAQANYEGTLEALEAAKEALDNAEIDYRAAVKALEAVQKATNGK